MLFVVTPKFWGDKTVSKYNSTKHRPSHVRKLEMANYNPGPVILMLISLTMTAGHIIQHAFSVGQ